MKTMVLVLIGLSYVLAWAWAVMDSADAARCMFASWLLLVAALVLTIIDAVRE